MKKLFYTLILCFFALNLSADIYVVSKTLSNFTITDLWTGEEIPVETKSGRGGYNYVYKISDLESGLDLNFNFGSESCLIFTGNEGIQNGNIYYFYKSGNNIEYTKLNSPIINVTINLDVKNCEYPQDAFKGIKPDYYKSVKITGTKATYSFFEILNPNGATIKFPQIIYISKSDRTLSSVTTSGKTLEGLQNNDIIHWYPQYRATVANAPENSAYVTSSNNVTLMINVTENKTYTGSESRELSKDYTATEFGNITYSMTYSKAEVKDWLFISAPYDATVEVSISNVGNIPLTYTNDPNKGYQYSCFLLRSFNSQKRANGEKNYWDEKTTPTIEAGKGYILGIDPRNNNGDITVTYKSINSSNTRSTNKEITLSSYIGNFEAGQNQHLIGTGLFYNSAIIYNNQGEDKSILIAIPGEDGYKYEIHKYTEEYCTLAPFSAFFFKFNGTFSITERDMVISTANAPMARSKNNSNNTPDFEHYNIKINSENISKETTILMNNDGNQGPGDDGDFLYFTANVDGIPFANQFYSIDQDYPLAFNHSKRENQTISLGGCLETAGEYTISLEGINTTAKSVLLTDTYDGSTTELTTDDYTFTATAGEVLTGRFVVTFSFAPDMPTDTYIAEANQIVVFGNAQNCSINNLTIGENVMIYDATGRLVYNQTAQSENININLIPGTYIVRQTNKSARFAVK